MKSNISHTAVIALAASVVLSVTVAAMAQSQYELVLLPTFGGNQSEANGISENGLVVGWASYPANGGAPAAMWDQNGNIIDLGSPPGNYYGRAFAVNDNGEVAATGEANPQTYAAFFWENGVWTLTGMLPENNESIARDIDAAGRVVGQSFNLGSSGPDRAILWDAGVLTDLGTLGGSYSIAFGINDAGRIVGRSQAVLPNGQPTNRAFVWENGQMSALEPLSGKIESQAFGLNAAGDVVGSSWGFTTQFLTTDQATLWRANGDVVDLGFTPAPPPGSCVDQLPYWTKSIARGINDNGQIVGEAMCVSSGGPKAAFLWQDGVNYNLNNLISAGSGLNLVSARGINNAGQIVGLALDANNYLRAYLLNPLSAAPVNGDFDGDGDVDLGDFEQFAQCFGGANNSPSANCPPGVDADFDGDGDVDLSDFAEFSMNFTGAQ